MYHVTFFCKYCYFFFYHIIKSLSIKYVNQVFKYCNVFVAKLKKNKLKQNKKKQQVHSKIKIVQPNLTSFKMPIKNQTLTGMCNIMIERVLQLTIHYFLPKALQKCELTLQCSGCELSGFPPKKKKLKLLNSQFLAGSLNAGFLLRFETARTIIVAIAGTENRCRPAILACSAKSG